MAKLRLAADLDLDGRRFFQAMDKANKKVEDFASRFKRMVGGTFALHLLKRMSMAFLETIDRWDDLADQMGTSRENVQRIEQAFVRAGLSGDAASTAMAKLSQAVDAAKIEGKTNAFDRLGISLEQLAAIGDDTGEVLKRVAEAIKDMDRESARDIARELFGQRAGEKFLAALTELRQGGGEILSEDDVRKIATVQKAIEAITLQSTAAAANSLLKLNIRDALHPSLAVSRFAGGMLARLGWRPAARAARTAGFPADDPDRQGSLPPLRNPQLSAFNPVEFNEWQTELKVQREMEESLLDVQQKMLSVSEQRANVEARINDKLREAARLKGQGDISGAAALQRDALDLFRGLPSLGSERQPELNELQRIGGFAGPTEDRLTRPLHRQVVLLERIERSVQENTRAVKEKPGGAFE